MNDLRRLFCGSEGKIDLIASKTAIKHAYLLNALVACSRAE